MAQDYRDFPREGHKLLSIRYAAEFLRSNGGMLRLIAKPFESTFGSAFLVL
jgi:hypothetical protein